jgi:hypothetical protein
MCVVDLAGADFFAFETIGENDETRMPENYYLGCIFKPASKCQ